MKKCSSNCDNCRHLDRDERFQGINDYVELYKYACCFTGEICQYISNDDELKIIFCEHWKATDDDMIANRIMVPEFESELNQRLDRWDSVKKYGADAPCWTDGISANIIRNQIIDIRNRVEQYLQRADYPKAYFKGVPIEMDVDYMARPEYIRTLAELSLKKYDVCEDFQWIAENISELPARAKKDMRSRAENVLAYRQKLADAIAGNDYVTMKIYQNADNFLKAFASCRAEMEGSLPKKQNKKEMEAAVQKRDGECNKEAEQVAGQQTLFDYLAAQKIVA